MTTFTFTDASDSHNSTMNNYLINHEINLIKIAIRNSISKGIFYATLNNTLMTSVNYNLNPTITITDTTGTGAEISCNIGSIEKIQVINQQGVLTGIPQIQVIGDGNNGKAHCEVSFSIHNIKLTNFPYCPNKNANITVNGSGTGLEFSYNYNNFNYLTSLTIINSGSGYDTNTTLNCEIDGKEFDLTYTIDYTNGIITDIIIDDNGYNYTNANVLFFNNNQPYYGVVANVGINSGISNLTIVNPGNNYSENTKITISGGNNDAIIEPVITNGQITSLNIVNEGTGYNIPPTNANNGLTYFQAWKGTLADNNLRDTLNEQMMSVISYFQTQGYNITRIETCNNLFYWLINF